MYLAGDKVSVLLSLFNGGSVPLRLNKNADNLWLRHKLGIPFRYIIPVR